MNKLERKALLFAKRKHGEQKRLYTGEPYITHCIAVAEIVRSVPHTPEMIAASLLHDTVEDTDATLEEIEREFGSTVAALVEMVTDVSRPGDGLRPVRKEIDRQHVARASAEGQTIKLADMIHNSGSILEFDPEGFARTYIPEKKRALEVLVLGDKTLMERAWDIVIEYENR